MGRIEATCQSWRLGPEATVSLDRAHVMGIVNVTPDSFSDGGRFQSIQQAVDCALSLVDEGAGIIDVGGESTRPGAPRVDAEEQISRTVPVIEGVRARSPIPMSIDTTLAAVASAALESGADIVNDVSAGLDDDQMADLVAQRGCGVVLMHRLRPPSEDRYSDRYEQAPEYGDVVAAVGEFLLERARAYTDRGVDRRVIAIDPGLGFGKTVEQNFELMTRVGDLMELGYPVLIGASRKSFLGAVSGESAPSSRLAASIAATTLLHGAGVRLFRVHDVRAHCQAISVTEAVDRVSQGDRRRG